jgi:hypothetical protein
MASRSRRKNTADSVDSGDNEAAPPRRSTRKTSQQPPSAAEQEAASSMPPPVTKGKTQKPNETGGAPPIARRGIPRKAREKSASLPTLTSAEERHSSAAPLVTPAPAGSAAESVESESHRPVKSSEEQRQAKMAVMKVMLKGLYSATDDLNGLLVQPNLGVQDAALRLLREPLHGYRAGFTKVPGEPYIDLHYVLETLSLEPRSSSAGLISRIVVLANLTALLDNLSHVEEDTGNDKEPEKSSRRMLSFFQTLETVIPLAFVHLEEDGLQHATHEVCDLALNVRMSCFIEALRYKRDRGHDALSYVAEIFYSTEKEPKPKQLRDLADDKGDGLPQAFKPFEGIDPNTPGLDDFWQDYRAHVRSACICSLAETEFETLRMLDETYPRDALLQTLRTWAHAAFEEVKSESGHDISKLLRLYHTGELDRAATLEGDIGREPIAAVAGRTGQWLAQVQPPPSGQSASISSYDIIDHQRDLPRDPDGRAASTPSVYLPAVEDIEAGPSQSTIPLPAHAALAGSSRTKRPLIEDGQGEEADGDDDDAFETDNRLLRSPRGKEPMRPQKRLRQEPPVSAQKPPPTSSSIPATQPVLATIEPNSQQQPRPSSQAVDSGEHLNQLALSQRTKLVKLARSEPAVQKRRVPWSDEDAETLLRAIATHGARWAELEKLAKLKEIPFQDLRDQQALRDKARLMKMHFLM